MPLDQGKQAPTWENVRKRFMGAHQGDGGLAALMAEQSAHRAPRPPGEPVAPTGPQGPQVPPVARTGPQVPPVPVRAPRRGRGADSLSAVTGPPVPARVARTGPPGQGAGSSGPVPQGPSYGHRAPRGRGCRPQGPRYMSPGGRDRSVTSVSPGHVPVDLGGGRRHWPGHGPMSLYTYPYQGKSDIGVHSGAYVDIPDMSYICG